MENCLFGLLGGLVLGVASSLHLGLLGKVTGMSGLWFSALRLEPSNWPAIVSGLVCTGSLAQLYLGWGSLPFGAQEQLTAGRSFLGFIVAGLLVGFGTKLGNGCTSGHGVCGLPRLSLRSLTAVLAFMTTGVITATLKSRVSIGVLQELGPTSLLFNSTTSAKVVAGLSAALFLASLFLGKQVPAKDRLIGFGVGSLFSGGLLLSGMTRRSNVLGFLTLSQSWNPALMCVMGGAVALNLITFRAILSQNKPLLAESFRIPTKREVDWQLCLGAAIFGVGWGLGGICPGPALTLLGTGDPKLYAWMASASVGMLAAHRLQQSPARPKSQ